MDYLRYTWEFHHYQRMMPWKYKIPLVPQTQYRSTDTNKKAYLLVSHKEYLKDFIMLKTEKIYRFILAKIGIHPPPIEVEVFCLLFDKCFLLKK